MHQQYRIFASAEALALTLAAEIIHRLEAAAGRDFHLAVSGGRTPGIIFERLALVLPATLSSRLHIWWADERVVPPDDPESNYGLFARTFLARHPLPAGQVHRIRGEAGPEEACAALREALLVLAEDECRAAWRCQPVFDCVLLGAGIDGHTASIFPGNEEIFASDEPCLAVRHPLSGQWRVTLTPALIGAAREVVYCVTGADKASLVAQVFSQDEGRPGHLPVFRVCSQTGATLWYLDREAAGRLPGPAEG